MTDRKRGAPDVGPKQSKASQQAAKFTSKLYGGPFPDESMSWIEDSDGGTENDDDDCFEESFDQRFNELQDIIYEGNILMESLQE